MKHFLAGSLAGATLVAALLLSAVALAQDNILALVRPLVVDVRQSVPVVADVIVPLDDGTSITATVPLTLDISLQVAVSGVVSESVQVAETEPKIVVSNPTPEPASDAIAVAQEEELIYQDFRWTVASALHAGGTYDRDPNDSSDPVETTNVFVAVDFVVENVGSSPANARFGSLYEYSIALEDDAGRRFDPYDNYYEDVCRSLDLNPGLSQPCVILFEVPPNASGFSIVFTTESGDEQAVDLGI